MTYTINTEVRNARVASAIEDVRAVSPGNVIFAEDRIAYKGGRFVLNGKRSNLTEINEVLTAYVEGEMYNEYLDAQSDSADDIAEEIKVNEAAALLSVSPVRIRRMCEEKKLVYGSRGHVLTAGVLAEIKRRQQLAAERAAKKLAPKAQKLGEATDD